jgi:hypothetical protein
MTDRLVECDGDTKRQELRGWEGWHRKRKIGRRKVSRSIRARVVGNLGEAWYFAPQKLGLNFNLFVTVRLHDIDALTPVERIGRWQNVINKVAQFTRDHDFECVHIWSRESDPGTGAREHLHLLTHVPPVLIKRFRAVASRWFSGQDEIDIRRADYRIRKTPKGIFRSMIGYVTKNSPQAAHGRPVEYRKGGPILGKRVGCSRNVDALARAAWEARRAVQREFGRSLRITSDEITVADV